MKHLAFAGLGVLLLLGTDAAAATLSQPVVVPAPAATTLHTTEASLPAGWLKRKKRKHTPAYRRHSLRRR